MVQCFPEGNFVIRMFLSCVPAIVTRLFANALRFLVEKVRNVCFWNDQDDDGETDTCENGQDPEYPLPQKISVRGVFDS